MHWVDYAWRVYCYPCIPTLFSSGLFTAWKAAERFYAEGFYKVEFNQPFYWLYSVPILLVIQHLVTLYLGGIVVRVVSEIE